MAANKTRKDYVNNQKFLEALIQYQDEAKESKLLFDLQLSNSLKNNLPEPPEWVRPAVPEYIGKCILDIADNLSHRPNFLNYPFREDMIGDGIENCLAYGIDSFDREKGQKPFAYFTQIIWWAFLRRIQREKTQQYIKYKCIQNSNELVEYVNQTHDEKAYDNTYVSFLRKNMGRVIQEFEDKKLSKKKTKVDPNSLEKFLVDELPLLELSEEE